MIHGPRTSTGSPQTLGGVPAVSPRSTNRRTFLTTPSLSASLYTGRWMQHEGGGMGQVDRKRSGFRTKTVQPSAPHQAVIGNDCSTHVRGLSASLQRLRLRPRTGTAARRNRLRRGPTDAALRVATARAPAGPSGRLNSARSRRSGRRLRRTMPAGCTSPGGTAGRLAKCPSRDQTASP